MDRLVAFNLFLVFRHYQVFIIFGANRGFGNKVICYLLIVLHLGIDSNLPHALLGIAIIVFVFAKTIFVEL